MKRTAHFTRLLVVALLATAAAPLSASADDEAAALLAKHKAFVGWELGDGSIKSLRIDETISKREKDGRLTAIQRVTIVRTGLAYRQQTTSIATGRGSETGFTGSSFWYSTGNGFTVPLVSEERPNMLTRAVFLNEATTKLTATVRKRDSADGTPVVVLREAPAGHPFDLYIDPATGAYKRLVLDPDGTPQTLVVDAYAEAMPGKKIVSAYHYLDSSLTHSYDKVRANATVSNDEIAQPSTSAHWQFGSAGSTIPIELTQERIYVKAVVNGVPGRFILDTGASGIGFTDKFADSAKLQHLEATTFLGIAGTKRGSLSKATTIAFADGSTLRDVYVSRGFDMGNERADGLLGFDFLAGAIVDLDLDANHITLYDPKTSAPNESGGVVVVVPDLSDAVPIIPVRLDGSTVSHATLDSGASGDVLVAGQFMSKLRVIIDDTYQGYLSSRSAIGGISGNYEIDRCGTIGSIDIGPIKYQNTRICFSRTFGDDFGHDASLIGFHFLTNFNMTFDYPDGKIVLSQRKH